ncbi:MAG: PepSY domain-containing protein [Caulobacteraceae bacterium]
MSRRSDQVHTPRPTKATVHRSLAFLAGLALVSALAAPTLAQDHREAPRRPESRPPSYESRRGPPPPYGRDLPARSPNSLGAGWRQQQEEARAGVRQGEMAPLGRVIEGIRRRSPGRQLDAGIEYQAGRAVYRVRWMTPQGRRVDYIVDAATGAILSER